MKPIPIGISDYKKVIDGNYYYVDKTLLISDILKSGEVILITRPRRFGKTLNLSMLRYFFELSDTSHQDLFIDKAIWGISNDKALQGQFPVISLTFKNITDASFSDMLNKFSYTIAQEFDRHNYLLESDKLQDHEIAHFLHISKRSTNLVDLSTSIEFLSRILAKHHQKKVIILIDEYDVPAQSAYLNGFYPQFIDFLKTTLTAALKDNEYLYKGVLTGILTLAKAGVFSGLNNLDIYDITQPHMADKFGFTASELEQFIAEYELERFRDDIKIWYNGYTFGEHEGIFNPWSVIKCISKKGELGLYWANTSDNALIKRLIGRASSSVKSELELLIRKVPVSKSLEESLTFADLDTKSELIWSLLLFAGYVTYTDCTIDQGKKKCSLVIPNKEIEFLYADILKTIFMESSYNDHASDLLEALTHGDSKLFAELLQHFILSSMSSFDLPSNEPEKSYHLFILGLLVMLENDYNIKSNRESGFGRYDIMIIPKNRDKAGIILEFKKVGSQETGESSAQKALAQIKDKKYVTEMLNLGISQIYLYGISFLSKQIFVATDSVSKSNG